MYHVLLHNSVLNDIHKLQLYTYYTVLIDIGFFLVFFYSKNDIHNACRMCTMKYVHVENEKVRN